MNNEDKLKRLFNLIEKLRTLKGLNKRELAIAADITPQYYSELLEGKKMPSIAVAFRLLDAVDAELMPVFKGFATS